MVIEDILLATVCIYPSSTVHQLIPLMALVIGRAVFLIRLVVLPLLNSPKAPYVVRTSVPVLLSENS